MPVIYIEKICMYITGVQMLYNFLMMVSGWPLDEMVKEYVSVECG